MLGGEGVCQGASGTSGSQETPGFSYMYIHTDRLHHACWQVRTVDG